MFRELYYAEPSDDQGNPFGIEAIEKCLGPVSAEPVAVWGWDLAKYQDWTVGVGLDASERVSVFERFQRPWEETVSAIRGLVGGTPALIDSTGVGDPIVERLQRTLPNVQGFLFSPTSNQRLMEGLAVAIQHEEISYPDGPIAQELRDFEFAYTRTGVRYSAPEGAHDDCVCGLALAVQMRSKAVTMSWVPVEEEKQTVPEEPVFYEIGGM